MHIISLEKGYAIITENDNGGYDIEDYEGMNSKEEYIDGVSAPIHLLPIGQIVIDRFNRSWDEYKQQGGKRNTALPTSRHSLSSPHCPHWIFPDKKPTNYPLSNIDFRSDLSFIPTTFIPFMGTFAPVFEVSDVSELYFYDLYRMKVSDLQIKQCKDCGHAFVAKTKAVRCNKCRESGAGEKQKWSNLKGDQTRSTIRRIMQRNEGNKRKFTYRDKSYNRYKGDLENLIAQHKQDDTADDFAVFVSMLDKADTLYYDLCKFYNPETNYDDEACKEWETSRRLFLSADNLIEWLRCQYEKAGIADKFS